MKNLPDKLKDLLPPGVSLEKELIEFSVYYLLFVFLYSLNFIGNFSTAKSRIFDDGIWTGEKIAPFSILMSHVFRGFWVLLPVILIFQPLAFRKTFFTGSKSIFLMKRLPEKHELLKRIFGFPLFELFLTVILLVILTLLYRLVYFLCTPKAALPGLMLFEFWRAF